MNSRAKPVLAWALVLLFASAGLLFLLASAPPNVPPPVASLLTLGFTNSLDRIPHAVLTLSNGSPREIICLPGPIEERDGTNWIPFANASPVGQWIGYPARPLPPSRTSTFLVPAPKTSLPWRVRFRCTEYRGGLDRLLDRIRDLPHFGNVTTRRFRGRRYELITPELRTPIISPSFPSFPGAPPTPSP